MLIISNSSIITVLFTLDAAEMDFIPLDSKEIFVSDKTGLERVMTLGLTNLAFDCPSIISAILISPFIFLDHCFLLCVRLQNYLHSDFLIEKRH